MRGNRGVKGAPVPAVVEENECKWYKITDNDLNAFFKDYLTGIPNSRRARIDRQVKALCRGSNLGQREAVVS